MQPIDQAQARPQVCEASPVTLACCVPVVSRHTRTEEARQVQEQDLGQKEHSQPGCVCALIALAHTVADGWTVVIKPVNAPAQHPATQLHTAGRVDSSKVLGHYEP